MTERSIVVLGDVNVDLLIRLPDRSTNGKLAAVPVPELCGGGTGGNTSVALARLGMPVAFVGMTGSDLYGRDGRSPFAYIYTPGVFSDLGSMAKGDESWSFLEVAEGINRRGMICGTGRVGSRKSFEIHGYLLLPN